MHGLVVQGVWPVGQDDWDGAGREERTRTLDCLPLRQIGGLAPARLAGLSSCAMRPRRSSRSPRGLMPARRGSGR